MNKNMSKKTIANKNRQNKNNHIMVGFELPVELNAKINNLSNTTGIIKRQLIELLLSKSLSDMKKNVKL